MQRNKLLLHNKLSTSDNIIKSEIICLICYARVIYSFAIDLKTVITKLSTFKASKNLNLEISKVSVSIESFRIEFCYNVNNQKNIIHLFFQKNQNKYNIGAEIYR